MSVQAMGVSAQGAEIAVEGDQHAVRRLPDGSVLASLVNGSESGWDTCCLWVSRLVLGALMGSLSRQRDPGLAGLERALAAATRAMAAQTPPASSDPFEVSPSATWLVAHVTPQRAEVAWMGTHRALLLRQGRVAAATRPHTLANLYRDQQQQEPPEGVELPDVCVRHLSAQGLHGDIEARVFDLSPGDRVALVTHAFDDVDEGAMAVVSSAGRLDLALTSLAWLPRGPRTPTQVAAVLLAP